MPKTKNKKVFNKSLKVVIKESEFHKQILIQRIYVVSCVNILA